MKSTAKVHLLPVGITNAYALDGGDGLVLIDTGIRTPENWDQLLHGFSGAGLRIEDVRSVLLTHAHYDHCGLAGQVRELTGAKILVHRDDLPLMSEDHGGWTAHYDNQRRLLAQHGVPELVLTWFDGRWRDRRKNWREDFRRQLPVFDRGGVFQPAAFDDLPQTDNHPAAAHETGNHDETPRWDLDPIPPDATFVDGDEFTLGNLRLRAIHTPGHTPGHTCFAMSDPALLFTGDHVLQRVVPAAGTFFRDGKLEHRVRGLPHYLRSLRDLRDLEVERVLPAHDEEIESLPKSVDRILRNYDRRTAHVRAAVESGAATAFEVLPRAFPSVRPAVLWAAMLETIGHLDLLEELGAITAEEADGLIRYRALAAAAR
ncbi:MAG: MBL fold metallo-hydrolase [Chloroflexi bacterium]|nr:MBL fold metallo-hydrolase [Chloroflexota bacterium]